MRHAKARSGAPGIGCAWRRVPGAAPGAAAYASVPEHPLAFGTASMMAAVSTALIMAVTRDPPDSRSLAGVRTCLRPEASYECSMLNFCPIPNPRVWQFGLASVGPHAAILRPISRRSSVTSGHPLRAHARSRFAGLVLRVVASDACNGGAELLVQADRFCHTSRHCSVAGGVQHLSPFDHSLDA